MHVWFCKNEQLTVIYKSVNHRALSVCRWVSVRARVSHCNMCTVWTQSRFKSSGMLYRVDW